MTDLPGILNWRRITDRITTSGQPTEEQLASIRRLGVSHIINLGPHHNKGALADEAGTVAALGMTYIYIPVEFDDPTEENFADFRRAVEKLADTTIHVHCIYNARVSAFFFRCALEGMVLTTAEAFANRETIWRPGDDWASLIRQPDARGEPNRYAGYEY
ncbi:protein tyrosine phosphatase family protein [uncultured Roseobacter sp.]|uniref:protein tyrosine phosphatase family protein n=1 Tax=uncultured Roseobacter sp. TaxID=114847 RepID=UPI002602E29C|nr:protein tyrosine phosphatase family protein [uncultured Roseobacter sp.]